MLSSKENHMDRLRRRLASSEGFTLIELLVVIVIIGILLAIAIPSYLGFRTQAQDTAGKANVREAVPSAESYFASNSTYANMTTTLLKGIDSGLSSSVFIQGTPSATGYCLAAPGKSGTTWYFKGPGGTITNGLPAGC
jgi:type IV pilus assembly protein PilA